jgi:hypothetical protein
MKTNQGILLFHITENDWPGLVIQWALSTLSKVALMNSFFGEGRPKKLKEKLMNARKSSSQPGQSSFIIKNNRSWMRILVLL